MRITKFFKKSALNISGWRTNKRIVIIESDDWGAIRMPSLSVFNNLRNRGFKVENCPYSKFDALEDGEDLEQLFDILLRHKDRLGRNAAITANTIVGNPDFSRIKDCDYKAFFFRPFNEFYIDRDGSTRVFDLWKIGIEKIIFNPQFHGR